MNTRFLKILLLLLIVIQIIIDTKVEALRPQPRPVLRWETIDNLAHFDELKWEALSKVKSVARSNELPGELKGKLEGSGIIYLHGEDGAVNQAVYRQNIENLTPGFLYVKYYTHLRGLDRAGEAERRGYVFPAAAPEVDSIQYLQPTSGFRWNEVIVELSVVEAVGSFHYVEIGAIQFREGDFLLFDKIALIQGQNLTMEQIRELFPQPDEVTTTETSYSFETTMTLTTNRSTPEPTINTTMTTVGPSNGPSQNTTTTPNPAENSTESKTGASEESRKTTTGPTDPTINPIGTTINPSSEPNYVITATMALSSETTEITFTTQSSINSTTKLTNKPPIDNPVRQSTTSTKQPNKSTEDPLTITSTINSINSTTDSTIVITRKGLEPYQIILYIVLPASAFLGIILFSTLYWRKHIKGQKHGRPYRIF